MASQVRTSAACRIAFFVCAVSAYAQGVATGPLTSYTPAAMVAGTPDGVSILSAHEAVNLYNGNLSFAVPLYRVGGRGGAGYSMVLPIGVRWNIENQPNNGADVFVPIGNMYPYEMLWPASAGPNRYSPGKILMREAIDPGQNVYKCTTFNTPGAGYTFFQAQTLTKITWLEADGTEHEFLDAQNSGAPMPAQTPSYSCLTDPNLGGPDRGRVFLATDASLLYLTPLYNDVPFAECWTPVPSRQKVVELCCSL